MVDPTATTTTTIGDNMKNVIGIISTNHKCLQLITGPILRSSFLFVVFSLALWFLLRKVNLGFIQIIIDSNTVEDIKLFRRADI